MALSSDIVSQFAKLMTDDKSSKETTVQGTVVKGEDGNKYVKIDGSDQTAPITQQPSFDSSTTNAEVGDRVMVLIKDHNAIVTGNISSPAPTGDELKAVETLVAKKVDTDVLDAELGRINNLVANKADIGELEAAEAKIDNLESTKASIKQLNATKAEIDEVIAKKIDADVVNAKFIDVNGKLTAVNADIDNLEATRATIEQLNATNASIENLGTKYANIDFANINEAAIRKIFSDSGLIKDLVVGSGTITGELVGVTFKGDLIEGGTVIADKLVVKGTDGLYYKLNTDGVTTEAEQTEYNSLNGSVITAKSITATKISVTDLVAFGATIGGFKITDNSIYSGVKSSVDNTTRGIYQDRDGQFAVGDNNNFFKFYKDTDGTYKMSVSADTILLGSSKKPVETAISDAVNDVEIGGRNLLKGTMDLSGFYANRDTTEFLTDESGFTYASFPEITTLDYRAISSTRSLLEIEDILGKEVVFSFEARSDKSDLYNSQTSNGIIVEFALCNDESTARTKYRSIYLYEENIDSKWTRYAVPVKLTEDFFISGSGSVADSTRFYVQIYNYSLYSIQIRKCKFEYGNKATDWSPSPEDLATAKDISYTNAEIKKLKDSLQFIVTDKNGTSLMTQTGDSYTFNISSIQESINDTDEAQQKTNDDLSEATGVLNDLASEVSGIKDAVDVLKQGVKDLGTTSEYVRIRIYEGEPCIELGKAGSDNKLLITNTRTMFIAGSDIPTNVTNKGVETDNVTIDNDLIQRNNNFNGYYVWKVRGNGHYGLQWKGGNS